jgi:hypothetical protein
MNEHDLQARVMKRLRQWGGKWVNIHGGPYQAAGVSDILGCLEGRFVAVELKHPKYLNPREGVTPTQWNFISQVRANGGYAIVANDEAALFEELELLRGELLAH